MQVWRKEQASTRLAGVYIGTATVANCMDFLRKPKMELPYDPAFPFLGIYPDKTIIQKHTCTVMFRAAVLTVDKTWEQTSINR